MSRVSRNWERLVRAVLRTRPSGGGGRFPSTGLADAVPPSLVKSTNIDAILQAADEVQDEDPNIARILCEQAYTMAQNLDPTSDGRGVLQFKTGLMSVIKQKRSKKDGAKIDREHDIELLWNFYKTFQQQQPPPEDPMAFAIPRQPQLFHPIPMHGRGGFPNWKCKKMGKDRKNKAQPAADSGYRPPALNDLQHQNRVKARRFYSNNNRNNKKFNRFAPYAPRNTTSFIIRAKKAGGIASLVSPCPVTPAILPTPKFSPSRERVVDMAKEEWGVDGYGSMKGLIRLRSPTGREEEEEEGDGEDVSSDSDVEERVEVERRLDQDLSRFEMVCHPNLGDESRELGYSLENRVDDQDTQIAHLEEENLTLKEKLFLMETEMLELRTRLQILEDVRQAVVVADDGENHEPNATNIEEVSDIEGGGDLCDEKSV